MSMTPLRSFFSSGQPAADRPAAAGFGVTDPQRSTLISTRNLEKAFQTAAGQLFVLRRITIDVQPGEFVSIMGPSGAGKSTLLSVLGMLDGEWTGEYYFLGHPVH